MWLVCTDILTAFTLTMESKHSFSAWHARRSSPIWTPPPFHSDLLLCWVMDLYPNQTPLLKCILYSLAPAIAHTGSSLPFFLLSLLPSISTSSTTLERLLQKMDHSVVVVNEMKRFGIQLLAGIVISIKRCIWKCFWTVIIVWILSWGFWRWRWWIRSQWE